MPFAGGTYTPPGPPVFPPNPGDVISSSYYITLINDIATALSQTFLRDGSLAFIGDPNFGNNTLKNLGAGTVSSPAIRFNDDSDTGIYLDGVGKLCLAVDGLKVAEFTGASLSFPSLASVNTAYAATITLNNDNGINFDTTLTGNVLIDNFSNPRVGLGGYLIVRQDGTGSRLASYGSEFRFPFGAPALSTAPNTVDIFSYYHYSSTITYMVLLRSFQA